MKEMVSVMQFRFRDFNKQNECSYILFRQLNKYSRYPIKTIGHFWGEDIQISQGVFSLKYSVL